MRVLVCGGREYNDRDNVLDVLRLNVPVGATIIEGGARGADTLARQWARAFEVPCETWKADWEKHGKAAGLIRNEEMLRSGIDLVIAFPGGRGTAHMKRIAREAGVKVIEG